MMLRGDTDRVSELRESSDGKRAYRLGGTLCAESAS